MVGISLVSSIAGTGFAGGALSHSVISAKDFEKHLQVTLDSTCFSGLPSATTELISSFALQNHRALDLLTTEKGGLFLQEEFCYYINESGLVEQNIDTLSHLSEEIQLCRTVWPVGSHPMVIRDSLLTFHSIPSFPSWLPRQLRRTVITGVQQLEAS
jgi:hypothetical protein